MHSEAESKTPERSAEVSFLAFESGQEKSMKRLVTLLALAVFIAACGSSNTTNQSRTYTTTRIQGTLPNWTQGAAEVTSASGGIIYTDGTIELIGPLYTGTVTANGNFSINLTTPPASELIPVTCGDQQMNSAGTGFLTISPDAPPTYTSEVMAYAGLAIPGDPLREVQWIYSDQAFRFSGECKGETVDLNLLKGWNTVILTYAESKIVSSPIPNNAAWTLYPASSGVQSLGILRQ